MRSAFSETLVLLDLAYVRQDSQKLYKKKTISRPMGVLTSRGTKMPINEDLIILETYVQQGFHI